jgi:sporulation protein YlmC with PRC-barrel domain
MIPTDRAARLQGYGEVLGVDGHRIGKVGQVYLEQRSGDLSWVTVRTGWFGNRESFVPMGAATVGDPIAVPYDRDTVKGAPHHLSDAAPGVADEDRLHAYHGIDSSEDGHDGAGDPVTTTDERIDEAPRAGIGHIPAGDARSAGEWNRVQVQSAAPVASGGSGSRVSSTGSATGPGD